jgi:hypothetical protein
MSKSKPSTLLANLENCFSGTVTMQHRMSALVLLSFPAALTPGPAVSVVIHLHEEGSRKP